MPEASRGFFSDVHCEMLIKLPDINLTKLGSLPVSRNPWNCVCCCCLFVLHLRISTLNLQQSIIYSSGFLSWSWFPWHFLLITLILVSHDSLYSHMCLQSWGLKFALCLSLSCRSKENYWIFHLFSFFLLIVRTEWKLPGYVHVELEVIYFYGRIHPSDILSRCIMSRNTWCRGAWVAQSVKHPTSAQVMIS